MRKRNVVIIDDDPEARRYLTDLLESNGFAVRTFENPFAALSFSFETRPDLIILDYRLPELDGLRLLPGLRAVTNDTPVLLLTAYGTPDLFREAQVSGVRMTMSKPVAAKDLLEAVNGVLV